MSGREEEVSYKENKLKRRKREDYLQADIALPQQPPPPPQQTKKKGGKHLYLISIIQRGRGWILP